MEQSCQNILEVTSTLKLPVIDVGAIARTVATKTASADIPAQLLFLPGQYLLVTRVSETVTYKFLSPEAVTAAFTNKAIDSGWLPASIVRWGRSERGEWAVQFYPPRRYNIVFSNNRSKSISLNVPMPGFVFLGCGTDYWIWAVLGKQFDPQSQLYHAPLPNVMASGAICFGDSSPTPCSPQGIGEACQLFWSSPFSDHAVEDKSKSHRADVRSLLGELSNRKSKKYPMADLKAIPNKTVNTIIEQIVQ
jgi:PRTRC genetic system protein B